MEKGWTVGVITLIGTSWLLVSNGGNLPRRGDAGAGDPSSGRSRAGDGRSDGGGRGRWRWRPGTVAVAAVTGTGTERRAMGGAGRGVAEGTRGSAGRNRLRPAPDL